jgi:hypothetical protein
MRAVFLAVNVADDIPGGWLQEVGVTIYIT